MNRTFGAFLFGLVVGAAACAGGAYLYARPAIWMLSQGPYIDAASQAKMNVAVLRRLHAGDVRGATEIMERRLDADVATLSGYEGAFSEHDRDDAVLGGKEEALKYKREFQ